MAHLAKTAGVKRSSAYYAIDELQRRGFFSIKRKGKRIFYKAASPEQLIKMTEARLKEVMKLYPSFKRLTND
jgi:sugar-specific transcriptional regulator TrmB